MTTLEETRRLPTKVITFPMTAISRGLAAGMRLQQNIAEMAIKGDEFFAPMCDKSEEQPAWAHFDEDDAPAPLSEPAALTEVKSQVVEPAKAGEPAKSTQSATSTAPEKTTAPAKPAAKKTPAPAKKKPAAAKKKPAAPKPAAPKTDAAAASEAAAADAPGAPSAGSGRFALYSSTPEDLAPGAPAAPAARSGSVDAPEIAELLDYDQLTLAQLRTKLRGLSSDELQDLADYERAARNRAPFVTMLDNRIASSEKKADEKKSGAAQ
ncbi:lipid droplet-associated protein [Gordonia sp. VNK21]|uniref:lipid droplet-associated protein n=1 Tax=Gordonia sp. VNK21 TaxID=3382483 RepID=UPI0038D4BF4B